MEFNIGNVLRMLFYLIVLDQCQNRRHCRLLASTTVFGQDPCPSTNKYLEVTYKCRPNEFRSREVCEGSNLELKCTTRSRRMAIYSANYGWSHTSDSADKCAGYSRYSRPCQSDCAYRHVYRSCHGRKRCTMRVSDTIFQSNCAAETPAFLRVVFTCVPRRILKDIDDEVDHPDPCDAATDEEAEAEAEAEDEDEEAEDEEAEEEPTLPDSTDDGNHNYGNSNHDYGNANHDYGIGNHDDRTSNGWNNRDTDDTYSEVNGEHNYQPKPSTIDYNEAAEPETDHSSNGDNHDDVNIGIAPNPESGPPTSKPRTSAVQKGVAGFVSDWIFTWNFIKENTEKFILYIVLGVTVGIICVLLVIICRVNQLRHRGKREAKLNISEPIANSTVAQNPETTSLLDASDPSDGGVEMTSYNQIGSLHRPPVSSFTDPYEEETPVSFPSREQHRHDSFGRSVSENPDLASPTPNSHQASYTGSLSRKPQNGGNGTAFTGSLNRPNHSRQTSFTGSLGRNSQPGMLTGSLNRRDHWTNEYRNDGPTNHHTIQHYYG